MSNFANNESGFTLVEIMVAFFVLTVGLVAVSGTFPVGIKVGSESENQSTVSYASQQKLEELISKPYSEIATGTIEAKHVFSDDPTSDLYKLKRETIITLLDQNFNSTTTDIGLKKATVNVYYTNSVSKLEKKISSYLLISRKQ